MTIAIHESALIRHFNTRKEVLRAWEEKIGARFSPFRGFKMPDSRLYIEDSDFLDSIVDLIITNERHVFIRGPVGSGKSTLMLLALRDLPTLADRKGNKFITGYVGMTGLYEKQMASAIADSLRIKYRRSWESSQIIDAVAKESLRRYLEEKSRTALFIEDVADNQEAAFHKLRFLADLPTEEMIDAYSGALDEPIFTLVMSGTLMYWNAMLSFLPQIADRTEPLDVPVRGRAGLASKTAQTHYAACFLGDFDSFVNPPTDYPSDPLFVSVTGPIVDEQGDVFAPAARDFGVDH